MTISPRPVDRREHRRARADADPRLAAAQALPLVVALALGELGVQHRHGVAEARHEARDDLRRQRDLGHEHDRALAAREHAPRPRRGRPRSCPEPVTPCRSSAVAARRGGDRRAAPPPAPASAPAARAARADREVLDAPARRARGPTVDEPAALEPPQRLASRAPPSAAASRAARAGGSSADVADLVPPTGTKVSHLGVAGRVRSAHSAVFARAPAGGRTSWSARANVEQYSRAIHAARSTRSGGTRSSSTRRGRDELLGRHLGALGHADDDAGHVAAPERHDEQRPLPDAVGPQVVERPAERRAPS